MLTNRDATIGRSKANHFSSCPRRAARQVAVGFGTGTSFGFDFLSVLSLSLSLVAVRCVRGSFVGRPFVCRRP